ncbi:MAG: phosphotransferase [Devosia sp.]
MADIESDIAALPIWAGTPQLEPLAGGLSNLSLLATDRSGKYVVRVTRDFPFHQVYRDRELMAARAAHAGGFAPEIVYAVEGITVSRYVHGRALVAADVKRDIPRIADLVRRFHTEMPALLPDFDSAFWVFDVNRHYLDQLQGAMSQADLAGWSDANSDLEAAQDTMPQILGHHDLLPANLIDDGRRLWLIDYEYAGFDTAMFDLANLSSNSGFSPDESETLLAAYFGGPSDSTVRKAHAAMEAASLLREALWSLVSIQHLDRPGVDYRAYANEHVVKFDRALAEFRARFR